MAYVLTLLYIALSLVSPAVLPDAVIALRPLLVVGIFIIFLTAPGFIGSNLPKVPDLYLLIGLLFASAISSAATGWIGSSLTTFTNFLPVLITLCFVAITCRTLRRIKILVSVLVLVAFFIFAMGLLAFYSGNLTSAYLLREGLDGNSISLYRFRGLGVLGDPNDLAQFFVMLIPLLWLRWKKGSFAGNFLFTLLPAALLIAGIFYTHSRGGSFALITVLLFGLKDKLGLVKSSVLAAGALALLMAVNISGGRGMNDDDGDRVGKWYTGLQVIKSHPLFGIGVDQFSDYDLAGQTAHNSYMLCMAEEGMLGYFCWMGLLVSSWSALGLIAKRQKKQLQDGSQEAGTGMNPPVFGKDLEQEPVVLKASWDVPPPQARQLAMSGAATAVAFKGFASHPSRPKSFDRRAASLAPLGMSESAEATENGVVDDAQLAHFAKIVQTSMVGFLVAAFFLSRTYSIQLYVLLGVAVALKLMDLEKHPNSHLRFSQLVKRILPTIFGSLIVLYLVVRFHGG